MARIVVVEDDLDVRESIKEILELSGFDIEVANDGLKGLEKILDSKPELVVSDVNMPNMDGFEMLVALNQNYDPEAVFPSFLFLTARAEVEDMESALSLGADDYIIKPFETSTLIDRINSRLEKRERLVSSGVNQSRNLAQKVQFNKLALPSEDGLEIIEFDQILRCIADRAYCKFHLANGKSILVSKPMKEFEDHLMRRQFLKVHKSTIVNMDYVRKYIRGKSGYLVLEDGSHVDVSVRKRDEVLQLLRQS